MKNDERDKRILLDSIKQKYHGQYDPLYLDIEPYLASGLTLDDIKDCLKSTDSFTDFILCLENKLYGPK